MPVVHGLQRVQSQRLQMRRLLRFATDLQDEAPCCLRFLMDMCKIQLLLQLVLVVTLLCPLLGWCLVLSLQLGVRLIELEARPLLAKGGCPFE